MHGDEITANVPLQALGRAQPEHNGGRTKVNSLASGGWAALALCSDAPDQGRQVQSACMEDRATPRGYPTHMSLPLCLTFVTLF